MGTCRMQWPRLHWLCSLRERVWHGGDLRTHGFTELLFELLIRYQDHPHYSGQITVTDYLAWPVHIRMTAGDLAAFFSGHEGVARLVFLARDGERLEQEQRLELPTHEPDEEEWAEGLTRMRVVMRQATRARIVLGGRVEGYKGRMPGIAEETLSVSSGPSAGIFARRLRGLRPRHRGDTGFDCPLDRLPPGLAGPAVVRRLCAGRFAQRTLC